MSRNTMLIILSKTSAIFSSAECSTRTSTISILLMLFLLLYDPTTALKYPLSGDLAIRNHHQRRQALPGPGGHNGVSGGGGCPAKCSCKWRSGKKTVQCISADFRLIPGGIDNDTQVLDLTGNPLQRIHDRAFLTLGLTNLQKIFLTRCELREIDDDALMSVANLVELDLAANQLRFVPTASLLRCPILRKLALNENPIGRLKNASFADLSSLRVLDLSNCEIELIEANAFEGLKSLRNLHLNGNKLRALSGLAVDSLPQVHELNLHGNQWYCDCRLRDLREWMAGHNIPLSIPPGCEGPERLAGRSWAELDLDEFACEPRLQIPEHSVSAAEGDDARMECDARSSPTSQIDWQWKGRPIANLSLMSFGRQMYLIKEVVTKTEKTSTLYIMNVLPKDSGGYSCRAANKAGSVSGNVTLSVISQKREEVVPYSGEEVAGIVLGLMFVFLLLFLGICFFVLRNKDTLVTAVLSSNAGERKGLAVNHANQRGRDQIDTAIVTNANIGAQRGLGDLENGLSGDSLSRAVPNNSNANSTGNHLGIEKFSEEDETSLAERTDKLLLDDKCLQNYGRANGSPVNGPFSVHADLVLGAQSSHNLDRERISVEEVEMYERTSHRRPPIGGVPTLLRTLTGKHLSEPSLDDQANNWKYRRRSGDGHEELIAYNPPVNNQANIRVNPQLAHLNAAQSAKNRVTFANVPPRRYSHNLEHDHHEGSVSTSSSRDNLLLQSRLQNGYGSAYATLRLARGVNKMPGDETAQRYNLRPNNSNGNVSNSQPVFRHPYGGSLAALALEGTVKSSPDEGLGDEREYETDILD